MASLDPNGPAKRRVNVFWPKKTDVSRASVSTRIPRNFFVAPQGFPTSDHVNEMRSRSVFAHVLVRFDSSRNDENKKIKENWRKLAYSAGEKAPHYLDDMHMDFIKKNAEDVLLLAQVNNPNFGKCSQLTDYHKFEERFVKVDKDSFSNHLSLSRCGPSSGIDSFEFNYKHSPSTIHYPNNCANRYPNVQTLKTGEKPPDTGIPLDFIDENPVGQPDDAQASPVVLTGDEFVASGLNFGDFDDNGDDIEAVSLSSLRPEVASNILDNALIKNDILKRSCFLQEMDTMRDLVTTVGDKIKPNKALPEKVIMDVGRISHDMGLMKTILWTEEKKLYLSGTLRKHFKLSKSFIDDLTALPVELIIRGSPEDASVRCPFCFEADQKSLGNVDLYERYRFNKEEHVGPDDPITSTSGGLKSKEGRKFCSVSHKTGDEINCKNFLGYVKWHYSKSTVHKSNQQKAIYTSQMLKDHLSDQSMRTTPTSRVLSTMYFVIDNNLPFSSHLPLLSLQQLNGVDVGVHHYSRRSMVEGLNMFSYNLHSQFLVYLVSSDEPFTLLLDTSTDKTGRNFLVIQIRLVFKNYPMVLLWHLVQLERETGDSLMAAVTSLIESDEKITPGFRNYFRKRLLGFGSDGAAVLVGENKGFRGKLNEFVGRSTSLIDRGRAPLIHTHCTNHRLELALKHKNALGEMKEFTDSLVRALHDMFGGHAVKRISFFANICNVLGIKRKTIHGIFDVRWAASHKRAVTTILDMYGPLLFALREMGANKAEFDVSTRKTATILFKVMSDMRHLIH